MVPSPRFEASSDERIHFDRGCKMLEVDKQMQYEMNVSWYYAVSRTTTRSYTWSKEEQHGMARGIGRFVQFI